MAIAQPGPAPRAEVTIHLDSEPRGATLKIDGVLQGTTPLDVVRARDTTVALELSLPGYVPLRETRMLKTDLELQLTLQKVAPPPPRIAPSPARPPKRTKSDLFHRFE